MSEEVVSREGFFNSKNDFELAINGLYSSLRSTSINDANGTLGGNLYWDVAADALFFNFSWHTPWTEISKGNINPNTNDIGFVWSNAYSTINWANTILEQLEAKKDLLEEDFVKSVRGEAHFVRAISYLRLTSLYGAVPLVDRILTPVESKLPRTSVEDITRKLIIPDLDIASNNLDQLPYEGKWGKATKQAAMGLKVRALLYIKDYQGTVKAAEELMTFADISRVEFLQDFNRIFANDNENNGEILFSIKYVGNGTKQGSTFATPFGPSNTPGLTGINGSWQASAIVPEYVNSFYMKDGLPADQSPLFDASNPWANRGTRFESTFYVGDHSILPNGQAFTIYDVGTWNSDYKKAYPINVDKGYMNEDSRLDWTNEDNSDFIILRYTDVLLMYAEAKTELAQVDASVYTILNKVRERAGIDPLQAGLSQNNMRETIRLERKLEFAFEGLRYFDIRRWGIAEVVINSITSDDPDNGGFNFGTKKLFRPANYLWPIPQNALDVNPNLTQNEGY